MSFPSIGLKIAGPLGPDSLELTDFLGNGAFGLVFKAEETASGQIFAVKFPQVAAFDDRGELLAFENEVKASQEIKHPNVTCVVHVELTPASGLPYFVMEYVDGGTLLKRIEGFRGQSQNVPVELIMRWVAGILDGVSAINSKMLHRDIKLDNILMSGEVPRIADFGLSKLVGAATRTKTFKGVQHLLYKAPEGWKNETNAIQMDMYSVGLVVYELVTLKYPYNIPADLSDIDAVRRMHLFEQAPSVEKLRPDLPLAFCHWVQRLIAKRPNDRFPDWNAAIEKFRECWGTANPPTDPAKEGLMESLLKGVGQAHDAKEKRDIEKGRIAEERDEWKLRNKHQREFLIQKFDSFIDNFNTRSSLGTISRQSTEREDAFYVPHSGSSLAIGYFEIDPPLQLKKGTVRYAGLLAARQATRPTFHTALPERGLFNFLLLEHSPDDFYGTWIVCEVSRHAFARSVPVGTPKRDTFGFGQNLIREIETSDRAMHIFTVSYFDDVQGAIAKAINECLSSSKP